MWRCLKILVGCVLLLVVNALQAQKDKERAVVSLLENWMEDVEENFDYESFMQELYALYDAPLPINTATPEDLQILPMLSEIDIANLLNYRNRVGHIYTLYELNAITGFSPALLRDLQPFITFESFPKTEKPRLRDVLRYSNNSLLLRGQRKIEQQYGYKDLQRNNFKTNKDYQVWQHKHYLGNPWRYYLRYATYYKKKFKAGLVAEKDSGEEFFSGTQNKGFDHYAGFVQVNNMGIIKTVVVGDYLPQFGQGLVTWGGYSIGKSGYFTNVNKRNEGLRNYASTNENKYFRGIAVTVQPFRLIQLTAYYSHKKIDANTIASEEEDEQERFSSFLNSGYHRSRKELENRKTVGENIMGANASLRYKNLHLGANLIDYKFSKYFERHGDVLQNLFTFSGSHGRNYSAYVNYRYDKVYAFGEAAFDKKNGKAFLGGVIFRADERFHFSLLYRDYAKNYNALYASGFGDKSNTQNEQGWYIGMEMLPWAKWRLSAYFDMYEFPWLRAGISAPARGHDSKIRVEYVHSPKMNAYLQFYQEQNQKSVTQANQKTRVLVNEKRTKVRIQLAYEVLPNLRFKNRLALSFYKKGSAADYHGFLLYHDMVYSSPASPFSLTARYALFDVDDYQARIYTYENDILYAFSMPAFQNRGFRFYWNAKWNINEHLSLWAKYAITQYSDRETIGSGLNLIEGNRMQELKLQLRYKF